MNKHTPERFPTETQTDYRARRLQSHLDAALTSVPAVDKNGFPTFARVKLSAVKNGGHRGAGMANIRAARKARNVRRHRVASRG